MKKLLTLATLLISLYAQSTIYYVDDDSNALFPSGLSWGQAFQNLDDVGDAIEDGDQVWVAEGFYFGTEGNFHAVADVEYFCGFQGWETNLNQRDWENNICYMLDTSGGSYASGLVYVIPGETGYALVDGAHFLNWNIPGHENALVAGVVGDVMSLEIRNCTFTNMNFEEFVTRYNYVESQFDIVLENCVFTNVDVMFDLLTFAGTTSLQMRNCTFESSNFGGPQFERPFRNCDLLNCSIRDCEMQAFASFAELENCLIENCLFASEDQSAWNHSVLKNCTVVNNNFWWRLCAETDCFSTIFYGNESFYGTPVLSDSQTSAYNCLIQEPFTGDGLNNSLEDPAFEDPVGGNWNLTECSPAVDNAFWSLSASPTDLNGDPRIFNSIMDIGCYEFQELSKRIIYVADDATGNNDGTSWANAFNHLQDAIDAQCDFTEIWIKEGIYYPNPDTGSPNSFASFSAPSGTEIYGGFEGDESNLSQRPPIDFTSNYTSLSGANGTPTFSDNAFHIMSISSSQNVLLDGLYFIDGNAVGTGGFAAGGGIYILDSEVEIRNSKFEFNTAYNGGSLFIAGDSQVDINHCEFAYNYGSTGGAISCTQSGGNDPVVNVDRSWFYGNSAEEGGALYTGYGDYEITNTIFNANNASTNGDAIYMGGTVNLINCTLYDHEEAMFLNGENYSYNCIFWNNSDDFNYGQEAQYEDIKFCNLTQMINDEGNTSLDPLFEDANQWDFRLQLGSPCINTGANAFSEGEEDRGGNIRVFDGTVDKGAHEINTPCTVPNDICAGAVELDVYNPNTVNIDMSCATSAGFVDVTCGDIPGARSAWYHFSMPEHSVEIKLADNAPDDCILSLFKNNCTNPTYSQCGDLLIVAETTNAPGQDIFVRVVEWGEPELVPFEITPIFAQILDVVPTQQSDCFSNTNSGTYDQQIVVQYENAEYYDGLEVNGQFFATTGSPQYITLSNQVADGDYLPLNAKIIGSSAEFNESNFVLTPCCAPLNDNCSDPYPLNLNEIVFSTLNCATEAVDDILSSCTTNPGRSLWFELPAPASGSVFIDCKIVELNGPFNVRMSVWDVSDGCADAVEVGCINQYGDNIDESGEISGLNPGQYYQIMVSGYETQKGTFSLYVEEIEAECGCLGDFNQDCIIGTSDLLTLLAEFGCTSNCIADMNGDGLVTVADMLGFLSVFGSTCL